MWERFSSSEIPSELWQKLMTSVCDGCGLFHLSRLTGVLSPTMQCVIQNAGKSPVKSQYWKFLHLNTVYWALFLRSFLTVWKFVSLLLQSWGLQQDSCGVNPSSHIRGKHSQAWYYFYISTLSLYSVTSVWLHIEVLHCILLNSDISSQSYSWEWKHYESHCCLSVTECHFSPLLGIPKVYQSQQEQLCKSGE